jgi:hypothetical protein
MNPSIESYFAALHARLPTALPMRHRKVVTHSWKPNRSECHANVDYWADHNPPLRIVRGWMIVSEDQSGRCQFEAHSVIGDGQDFFDITLQDEAACASMRFLPHIGTEEEFRAIEKMHRQVVYPPFSA